MRRLRLPVIVAGLAVLLAAALAVWRLAMQAPAIDAELTRLPGVVDVQSAGPARAKVTVVHLLDWHLVPRDQLIDPGQRFNMQRHGVDPEQTYATRLDAVQAIQKEHEAILRRLADKHGKLTVFIEGLTDGEAEPFVLKASILAKADAEETTEARRMLDEVNFMKQTPAAKATADELAAMIGKHRAEVLGMGVTMRLIQEGLAEVRALEDAEALRKAKPDKDGIDAAANAARDEVMAKRLADVEGLAVVILGGKHHLTKALQKWAPGLRYIRVVTKAYQQAAGEWYGAFRDGCSPRLCERRRTMR